MKKLALSTFSTMLLIVVTSTTINAQSKMKEATITTVEVAPLNKMEAIAPTEIPKKHSVNRTTKNSSLKRVEKSPKTKPLQKAAAAQPIPVKVIKKKSIQPIKPKTIK